jgi:hypothetical protein
MAIYAVHDFDAIDGRSDDVIAIVDRWFATQPPGALTTQALADDANPNHLLLVTRWTNRTAAEQFFNGSSGVEAEIAPLLAAPSPPIRWFSPVREIEDGLRTPVRVVIDHVALEPDQIDTFLDATFELQTRLWETGRFAAIRVLVATTDPTRYLILAKPTDRASDPATSRSVHSARHALRVHRQSFTDRLYRQWISLRPVAV